MNDNKRPHRALRWFKVAWFAVSVALCLPFLILLALFVWEKLSWATDRDNKLFEATCDHCHSPTRPHRYAKSPDEWRNTVLRMLSKDPEYGKQIDLDKRERVVGALVRNRSASPRALFFFRCGQCHSRSVIRPYLALDDNTLSVLLHQHGRQNDYALQTWEIGLIERKVLAMRRGAPAGTLTSRADQYRFQRDCGICHTLRFLYRSECAPPRDDAQWTALAARMQGKAPDFIGKDEIPSLARQAKAICQTGKIAP